MLWPLRNRIFECLQLLDEPVSILTLDYLAAIMGHCTNSLPLCNISDFSSNEIYELVDQISAIYIRNWYIDPQNPCTKQVLHRFVNEHCSDETSADIELIEKRFKRTEKKYRTLNEDAYREARENQIADPIPQPESNRSGRKYDKSNLYALDVLTPEWNTSKQDGQKKFQSPNMVRLLLNGNIGSVKNVSHVQFAEAYKGYETLYDDAREEKDQGESLAKTINLLRLETNYHLHLIGRIALYMEAHHISTPYNSAGSCFWQPISTSEAGLTRTIESNSVLTYCNSEYISAAFGPMESSMKVAAKALYRRLAQAHILNILPRNDCFIPYSEKAIPELCEFFHQSYPLVSKHETISFFDDAECINPNTRRINCARTIMSYMFSQKSEVPEG